MANAGPGLVDTRVLGKPLIFSGKEEHYSEWHESLLSWAGLFNGVIAGHLENAKLHPREITFEELPAEMQVMTQMVFHMFMQICRGHALTIIRRVPRRNGFEALRRLHDRFYIKTDGKNIADFVDADIAAKLDELEREEDERIQLAALEV